MAIRKIPEDTKTFHFYNANPKNRRTGDCVIRAISTATGDSWDDTLEGLYKVAMKVKSVPNNKDVYPKYLEQIGWVKKSQPKKKDGTKYTGAEFVKKFKGTCIAHIGGHHVVCIKGKKVWDIWDSTEGCIGNYWVKFEDEWGRDDE